MQRYRQDELIAAGGAGAVYKGFDLHLQRVVAIKRLRDPSGTSGLDAGKQGTPEALGIEARTLSSLQHPNIVTVHDFGFDEDGHSFVVMEYINGQDLGSLVEQGPLTEPDLRKVAEQVLQGLVAAHAQGILHRDIKPRNLMMEWLSDGRFQVKLLDFGLAKFQSQPVEQSVDQGGAVLGSIHYMAPEQFERGPIDARTDLYSLGATLYYALTGMKAFDGPTAPEVMGAHLHHVCVPLASQRPDLPVSLCAWVERLMSRRPEDRPVSAREALDGLQNLRETGGPVFRETGGPAVPASVMTARFDLPEPEPNHGWIWIAGILVAAIAGAGGWYVLGRSPQVPSAAVPEPAAVSLDPFAVSRFAELLGQTVTVEGIVISTGESRSGKTRYLNFANQPGKSLAIAFRGPESTEVYPMTRLRAYVGKRIQVKGEIVQSNGAWLIFIGPETTIVEKGTL